MFQIDNHLLNELPKEGSSTVITAIEIRSEYRGDYGARFDLKIQISEEVISTFVVAKK